MNASYDDILERIAEPPQWFDEHAVPRFVPFHPEHLADIYATEACLLRIRCQNCGRRFDVALAWRESTSLLSGEASLRERIREKSIAFGDPPNVGCCPSGPTMSSDSDRVLQFWRREDGDWEREPALEVELPE